MNNYFRMSAIAIVLSLGSEQGSLRLQIARSCDRVAAETWI
ncbi:hypothetical protein [Pseudomonas amygdali]|nr:hypothetical protein [Pseudomonas amygdali]